MMMESQVNKKEQHYIPNDAVDLIWKFISKELRNKLTLNDMNVIIRLLIKFYDETGLIEHNENHNDNTPLSISDSIDDDIVNYLLKESKRNNIHLSEDEFQEILDGEYEYLKTIGAIDEEE